MARQFTSSTHVGGTGRTFSSSPSFMLRASRRVPADRDTALTLAEAVVPKDFVPNPQGFDSPTGAPTKAALEEVCPAHGLAVTVPAATARKAQVLIMFVSVFERRNRETRVCGGRLAKYCSSLFPLCHAVVFLLLLGRNEKKSGHMRAHNL